MLYPRIVEKKIHSSLDKPEIIILYGPRRVGKTTILRKLLAEIKMNSPAVLYSLDDPSSQHLFQNYSTVRLSRLFAEIGFKKGMRNYLLLDEIQFFPHVDHLLKLIYDHFPDVKVVATSSSSLLLLNSLTESLAGRKLFLEILPLTLGEFHRCSISQYFEFKEIISQKEILTRDLESFMVFGSYPEIVNALDSQNKIDKLRDILDSSLYKDIFIQESIKAPKALITLVQLLAYQIGNLVNLNELSSQLGISRNTVNEYISILEKFFIVFRLPPFDRNLRSELTSKQKIYFWDLGIRNAVIHRFQPFLDRDDKGALFENMIISSILKRNLYEGKPYQSFFWRTYDGFEIDLVLQHIQQKELLAFQISLSPKIRFSRAFQKYHPNKKIAVSLSEGYRYCL